MPEPIRGRGASFNPSNRFIPLHYEEDPARIDADAPSPRTQFYEDRSRSIISHNDSPDVGFSYSLNPYRGCEHGCSYCYARPFHEYLGFSAGLDFETKIVVKRDAPELLRRELMKPSWQPVMLALSGVTDAYQPIEKRLGITRQCLEVLAEFRHPVGIVTKNHLVTRDLDLLSELARFHAVHVFLSVTTLNADLARRLEPRASTPEGRLTAIRELSSAGIPVGVMVAPIIPGLTDHEIPAILEAAADAGARYAAHVLLRLPFAVKDLFEHWLRCLMPDKADKVLSRIRSIRGGRLNDSQFGRRMRGEGALAQVIQDQFELYRRRFGLPEQAPELSIASFRRPVPVQQRLFDEK
jgi:DNA repair photolyase